ncbi:MAG: peptidylprolyl isomerase [Bacteroidota bacterium]
MQIIQSIREKGAAIVIVVIALSLIGFILMDAKQGGGSLFGSLSNNVGKVNGETIDLIDFNKKVKEAEDMQAQRSGQRPTGTQTYQSRDQVWNQIVAEKVFFNEAKKLGVEFTAKELSYILLSNDASNPFLQEQSLKDSITGKLDVKKAQTALNNIKKFKGEQKDQVNSQIVDPLKLNNTVSKYSALLNASAYYPSWMEKKESAENSAFSSISFVTVPFSEISDSTVKVTDEEINSYTSKHKEQFKQEEGRNISYVSFSQLPSKEDSASVYNGLQELKNSFQADTNTIAFVARNTSTIDFNDDYTVKSKLNQANADTLSKLAIGNVFGPYVDKTNFVLAKMISTKQLPDSVNARHILIGTNEPSTGKPTMPDSTAKKLADSVYNAILAGADFTLMALKYSTDQGSKIKGGDLGTFAYGTMVPEFNEFCFTKSSGSKGVVKTQFGYHIIDLISQKDFKTAYKIAYVGKEISASDVTVNKSSLEATKASAEKNKEGLEKFIAKNGLSLTSVPNLIKENDYQIGALQDARGLVRWAFEAKKGNISEPFSIGDQFIVAVLDKINDKGVQDATAARPGCEAIIRNNKKAELIKKKIGSNPTLESTATAYGKTVQSAGADTTIFFNSQIINGVGMESKLIGASFNKEYQTKASPLIDGTTGVFIVKVNYIQNKTAETSEAIAQRVTSKISSIRSQTNGWYEGLRKQADIVDERSKHF